MKYLGQVIYDECEYMAFSLFWTLTYWKDKYYPIEDEL